MEMPGIEPGSEMRRLRMTTSVVAVLGFALRIPGNGVIAALARGLAVSQR